MTARLAFIAVLLFAVSAAGQSLRVQVASSGTSVSLSWTTVTGATSYTVRRASTYPTWNVMQSVGAANYATLATQANQAYVFTVIALDAQNQTIGTSNATLVTTFPFAHTPAAGTTMYASDWTELRTMLAAAMVAAGAGTPSWTNTGAPLTPIRAADISDLRNALNASLQAIGLTPPAYTDPNPAGVSVCRPGYPTSTPKQRRFISTTPLAAPPVPPRAC